MILKNTHKMIGLFSIAAMLSISDIAIAGDGIGQTIEINTRLHSFLGKPSWLLIIRDVDHGQNIPYLYDFRKGNNYWMALTYGRNYLIVTSQLVFNPYEKKINNFCNLESMGRIQRATSYKVIITGDLSPNTRTFTCNVLKYQDSDFRLAVER